MAKRQRGKYGNVLRGYWNGKWYDSSWELALIVYHHDHNIELTRNSKKFPYVFNRHTQYYQPDFILEDGSYVEVKGIKDYRSKRKLAQFPFPIKTIGSREIKPYLDYMKLKYGADWRAKLHSPVEGGND